MPKRKSCTSPTSLINYWKSDQSVYIVPAPPQNVSILDKCRELRQIEPGVKIHFIRDCKPVSILMELTNPYPFTNTTSSYYISPGLDAENGTIFRIKNKFEFQYIDQKIMHCNLLLCNECFLLGYMWPLTKCQKHNTAHFYSTPIRKPKPTYKFCKLEQISVPSVLEQFLSDFDLFMLTCCSKYLANTFQFSYQQVPKKLEKGTWNFFDQMIQKSRLSAFYQHEFENCSQGYPSDSMKKLKFLWQIVRPQWRYNSTTYAQKDGLLDCVCGKQNLTVQYEVENYWTCEYAYVGSSCIDKFHKQIHSKLYKQVIETKLWKTKCISCNYQMKANLKMLANDVANVNSFLKTLSSGYISETECQSLTCNQCLPTKKCQTCDENVVYAITVINDTIALDATCRICNRCSENPNYVQQRSWKQAGLCEACGAKKAAKFKTCFRCSGMHKCTTCPNYAKKDHRQCYHCFSNNVVL
jgi:hypothetical protein